MLKVVITLIAATLLSCAPHPTYTWHNVHEPPRDDATGDLEECKAYTARQYKPGVPAGEPYLKDESMGHDEMAVQTSGTWRPDRNPTAVINVNSQSVHDIPVQYTGYPGELDYSANYLDAILEKCMTDRGWEYRPTGSGEQ